RFPAAHARALVGDVLAGPEPARRSDPRLQVVAPRHTTAPRSLRARPRDDIRFLRRGGVLLLPRRPDDRGRRMSSETAIRVVDLEKRYRVWAHARPTNVKERLHLLGATLRARAGLGTDQGLRREVHALRGVSFDVGRGEVLGVIGRNGA